MAATAQAHAWLHKHTRVQAAQSTERGPENGRTRIAKVHDGGAECFAHDWDHGCWRKCRHCTHAHHEQGCHGKWAGLPQHVHGTLSAARAHQQPMRVSCARHVAVCGTMVQAGHVPAVVLTWHTTQHSGQGGRDNGTTGTRRESGCAPNVVKKPNQQQCCTQRGEHESRRQSARAHMQRHSGGHRRPADKRRRAAVDGQSGTTTVAYQSMFGCKESQSARQRSLLELGRS